LAIAAKAVIGSDGHVIDNDHDHREIEEGMTNIYN